jgi:4-diphosphocytidyl-2-C-methyl-D-erythritol kinase
MAFEEFAPAKVNLALHVTGRRDDGYHVLDSLVVLVAVGDVLRADRADELSLRVAGPFATALADEPDNLVLRAARALAATAGIVPRARLTLEKHLPVASGIGGGSADAAAALRLLTRLWRLELPAAEYSRLALTLGADVPVCLAGRPARMGGIGETLAAVPRLPPCGILLANPGVGVATPAVFRARVGPFSPPLAFPASWPDLAGFVAWLGRAGNDLEPPAIRAQPVIADVLATLRALPGCLLARMSGSGATCFALFADAEAAAAAARQFGRPWWAWGGTILP